MRYLRFVTFGLVMLVLTPLPCAAQWGWPPPGYSPTGVRACDGSRYRGLCEVLRDLRRSKRSDCPTGEETRRGPAIDNAPAASAPTAAPALGAVRP